MINDPKVQAWHNQGGHWAASQGFLMLLHKQWMPTVNYLILSNKHCHVVC